MNMKKIKILSILIIASAVFFLLKNTAKADTEVSGNITTNTVWTLTDSPFIVKDTVQVLQGVKLTLEPGVTIKFTKDTGMNIDGELVARGSQEHLIIFTSNEVNPKPSDWKGIKFYNNAIGTTFDSENDYISGSTFQYCKFEYSGGERPSLSSDIPLAIEHNIFQNNERAVILNNKNGSHFLLRYNNFSDNAINVMGMSWNTPVVTIEGSGNIITNNLFSNNGLAFFLSGSDNLVKKNEFQSNTRGANIGGDDSDNNIVSYNIIENNQLGISIRGQISLLDNVIKNNTQSGVSLLSYGGGGCLCDSEIKSNTISDNNIGLDYNNSDHWNKCQESNNNIIQNTITNNRIGVNYFGHNSSKDLKDTISQNNIYSNKDYNLSLAQAKDLVIPYNYWGSADSSFIDSKIYDYYDDVFLGKVLYEPFCATELKFDGTEVSGNITTDTVWTLASSPYIVKDTVQVLQGAKLTIEPGVVVKFYKGTGLNIDGEFIAEGTRDSMITFTSYDPAQGWGNIKFFEHAVSAEFDKDNNYVHGSKIRYCKIEKGGGNEGNDDYIEAMVAARYPRLFIDHNIIEKNGAMAIWFFENSGSVITNNIVRNNLTSGDDHREIIYSASGGNIFIGNIIEDNGGWFSLRVGGDANIVKNNIIRNNNNGLSYESKSGIVSGNSIDHNIEIGLNIRGDRDWYSEISSNKISNNSIGIKVVENYSGDYDGGVSLTNNNIFDNSDYNILLSNHSKDVNANYNYWGFVDHSIIEANIYDYYDDISLGRVLYEPFCSSELKLDGTDQCGPDITPPIPPTINSVISPTQNPTQTISGTKEADASVWLNGSQIVPPDSLTTWSYVINLNSGTNNLNITTKDASDNESAAVAVTIIYNPPSPPAPKNQGNGGGSSGGSNGGGGGGGDDEDNDESPSAGKITPQVAGASTSNLSSDRIKLLYQKVFNRIPKATELGYWANVKGYSLNEIKKSFFNSNEYNKKIKDLANKQGKKKGIEKLFQDIFGRSIKKNDLAYWSKQDTSILGIKFLFLNSKEYKTNSEDKQSTERRNQIASLYRNILMRPSDQNGLNYWDKTKKPLKQIRSMILNSTEFKNLLKTLEKQKGREAAFEQLFESVFNAAADNRSYNYYAMQGKGGSLDNVRKILMQNKRYQRQNW